eukprot:847554-Pleurochrysis_carterae.AAC.2
MPSHWDRSREEHADRRKQRARQQPAPHGRLFGCALRPVELHFVDKGSCAEGAIRAQVAKQIRAERRTRLEGPNLRGAPPLSIRAKRAEGPVANECTSPRLQSNVRWLA